MIADKHKERRDAFKKLKRHHMECNDVYGKRIWHNVQKNGMTRVEIKAFDLCRSLANEEHLVEVKAEAAAETDEAYGEYDADRLLNFQR